MFCKNCGKYIRGKSNYCSRCKSLILFSGRKDIEKELVDEYYNEKDKNSLAANFISFILPIIGIILFLLNKSNYPRKSHFIAESLIWGCVAWASVVVFFNFSHFSNIEILTNIQDMIVGNV